VVVLLAWLLLLLLLLLLHLLLPIRLALPCIPAFLSNSQPALQKCKAECCRCCLGLRLPFELHKSHRIGVVYLLSEGLLCEMRFDTHQFPQAHSGSRVLLLDSQIASFCASDDEASARGAEDASAHALKALSAQ
jgi:hypothetical protein